MRFILACQSCGTFCESTEDRPCGRTKAHAGMAKSSDELHSPKFAFISHRQLVSVIRNFFLIE